MDPPSPLGPLGRNIPSGQLSTTPQALQKQFPPPPPQFNRTVSEAPVSGSATVASEAPSQSTRPSSSGGHSFQRPRKRVIWHNKACWIALPVDSEFGKKTTRASFLGPEDVARRLREWENSGFDTRGFLLAPPSPGSLHLGAEGQSREVHPDPEDERSARSGGTYRVNIPDRREWEAYVNQLKEEKLRALGVSSGDEDLPRRSPAPSLMSRQASSQSSVMLTSPALAPQSVNGMPFLPNVHPVPNSMPYQMKPSVSHFPRYSMGLPFGEKPFSPTNQFPRPSQSPVHGPWPPQQYPGSRPVSRVNSPNSESPMPNMDGIVPLMPSPAQNGITQSSNHDSHDLLNQMRRQHALLQAQQLQQQHEQHQEMLQAQSRVQAEPESRSKLKAPSANSQIHPEVASPIPRSHRQNPSETLQKDLDKAGNYTNLESSQLGNLHDPTAYRDDSDKATTAKLYEGDKRLNSKTEVSGIDTKPSPARTPDHDRQVQGVPHQDHSSKAAASKLNVNAPEFKYEPQGNTDPETFAFEGDNQISNSNKDDGGSAQLPFSQSKSKVVGVAQGTKFNVDAPEFTPAAIARKPTVPSREFSFSASMPTFRPDAPAFEPSDSQAVSKADRSNKDESLGAGKKIFGEIKLSDVTKPSKNSKAVPIVKPDSRSKDFEKSAVESDGQEDESGRITQADGRQKRLRRDQSDGDEVPLFASPTKTPWLNHEDDDRAAYFSSTPSPRSEKAAATTLEAATDLLEEIIDDLSATEASELLREEDSVSGDGKSFEPHTFEDIQEAATFNTARPTTSGREQGSSHLEPTPNDVAEATMEFLGKSPQFKATLGQALDVRNLGSDSSRFGIFRPHDGIDRRDHARRDIMDGVRYVEPSYAELDAVMKHLNEDSDLGVEQRPSPFKYRGRSMSPVRSSAPEYNHTSRSPVRDSTQELYEISRTPQLLNPANFRSDAPSPSPNRLHGTIQYVPQTDSEGVNTSAVETIEQVSREIANNPLNSPSWPAKNGNPLHHLNSPGSTPPSDWNDAISSLDEDKFHSRIGFFDTRVSGLVSGVIQQRLEPLERSFSGIQQALVAMSDRSGSRRPRSSGAAEIEDSDADDEEETEGMPQKRLKSPLRDRKYDQLKSVLNDIASAQKDSVPAAKLAEVIEIVKDLKASIPQGTTSGPTDASDLKNIVEEAVGKQLRGRSAPVTSSSVAAVAEKSQLQIAGLESMLKVAESRADDELKARRSTEDALADSQRLLRSALQEAAEQRESAEATERTLGEYSEERQEMLQRNAMLERTEGHLQKTVSDLSEKNTALEDTLAEYRLSSDQWRTEIDDARHENKDLSRIINSLKIEIEENNESRQAIRIKFNSLQEELNQASQESAADQLKLQGKEQEQNARLDALTARLEAEARTRQRLELEIECLEAQEKQSMGSWLLLEQTQNANAQLQETVTDLRSRCDEHQNSAARSEREFINARESAAMELGRIRVAAEADVNTAKIQGNVLRDELEAMISRLRGQIETVASDAETARARHNLTLEEAVESRSSALLEAAAAREAALVEQSLIHERNLKEVKGQYERALKNALEDRERSETYFGNRLNLADEKVVHYQDRLTHLEERLEIAKSAAHAAVKAAQNQQSSLHRVPSRTTHQNTKGLNIPEKISPQALRESIAVLQEQLQERESRIEQLESELSTVDTTAPAKIKDAEVEINWLRELLGVRIDDLEDIIATLSQPLYNREAVKDAVIRLKANLQMEQQEKERALAGGQNFPSLASISNLAASPKALPLAAAAAWGNWRKSRESFGNITTITNGSVHQTPSKSSPQSFFAGLMTPPSTSMRTTPSIAPSSRPLSSSTPQGATGLPATPKQSLGSRHEMRPQQDPVTPPLMRKASYDLDASEEVAGFGDEGIEGNRMAGDDEEPFGPRLGGIVGTL